MKQPINLRGRLWLAWFPAGLGLLSAFLPLTMSAQNLFRLYTTSNHQRCDVFVNGFPFKEVDVTNTVSASTVLDPFLIKGTNTFVIRTLDATNVLDTSPSNAVILRLDFGADRPEQRQLLFVLTRQAFMSSGVVQEDVTFDGGDQFRFDLRTQLTNALSVFEVKCDTHEFHCQYLTNTDMNSIALPIRLDAPRLTSLPWQGSGVPLTSADRSGISSLMQSLYKNLTNKNTTNLLASLIKKTERVATAMGSTVAEQETAARQFYDSWFGSAAFAILPADFSALQLKTYPAANVVQVLVNNDYPIQGKGDGFVFKMPVYVSKIAGQWWIVE